MKIILEEDKIIAGIDEVGRGPLAGPVVAAAVVLPKDCKIEGVADSKTLSAKKRQELSTKIFSSAFVAIAFVPAFIIDSMNIHNASLLAMRRALLSLSIIPDVALFDGKFIPSSLPCKGEAIIKGDTKIPEIAAASIIAKVARDNIMEKAEIIYPGYGFAKNSGYPTKQHLASLKEIGLTRLHRISFSPCKIIKNNNQ